MARSPYVTPPAKTLTEQVKITITKTKAAASPTYSITSSAEPIRLSHHFGNDVEIVWSIDPASDPGWVLDDITIKRPSPGAKFSPTGPNKYLRHGKHKDGAPYAYSITLSNPTIPLALTIDPTLINDQ